ncbi:galactose oxidase [Linnemannia elongata]|nr:galactose oxidase [Linnemannia elongata]
MRQQQDRKQSKKQKKDKARNMEEQEEDIETILANFKKEQEEKVKIIEEVWSGPPSRRANATLTANPLNVNELIFFGGEFYDGARCAFYNDLYRYNIEKDEWRRITSPNSPGPRSSHQIAITPAGTLFLFGGEFASPNETQFFHYKDFWSMDMKTNAWEKLEVKPKPTARSGHRMTLWKNFLVMFGGFYDNYVDTRYYDDLWVFDTLEYKWTKVELPEQMIRPSARSGFSFIPCNEGVILYGGYCKEYTKGQRPKGVVHTDTWLLKMHQDPKMIRWEKKKKSGSAPSARSGCAMAPYKNRAVLFGGVFDDDVNEETLESTFFNELWTYQIDTGRWFPMNLKRPKTAKKKKTRKPKQGSGGGGQGGVGQDGEEKREKMKWEESTDDEFDYGDFEESDNEDSGANTPKKGKGRMRGYNANNTFPDDDDDEDEPLMPCPRYNTMLAVQKSTLFIFGGILEVKDREYTLDDFFSLNLDKMNEYICLRASEFESQLWLGEESDDEEEGEDDEDEESDDDDEDEDEEDEEGEEGEEEVKKEGEGEEEAVVEVVPSQLSGVDLAARLAMTEEETASTPTIGETLKEFYGRTTEYWVLKAFEDSTKTGKALRHDGFLLAEAKFNEWQPILAQMAQMRLDAGLDEEDDDDAAGRMGGGGRGGVLKMGEVYNKLMSRHRR